MALCTEIVSKRTSIFFSLQILQVTTTMVLPPLAFLCSILLYIVADAFIGNPPAILPSAVRLSSTASRHSVALTLQSNHHSRWRSFDLSSSNNACSPLIKSSSLLASSSSDNNIATNEADSTSTEAERLRQIANQLRAEADAAEKQLEPTRQQKQPPSSLLPPVECFDIYDSCWELTYRFANEPVAEEDEQKQDDDEKRQQRKVYSGKVKLKFKSDGYTTNLSSSSSQQQQQTGDITFQKVWGWDIETSDQDSYNYILFSADIITGTSSSSRESERFYFQARVDDDSQTGALQLNDGSVTVKRDIKLPGAGGFWGIFGGADKILARFRSVGEFKCKPIACNVDE